MRKSLIRLFMMVVIFASSISSALAKSSDFYDQLKLYQDYFLKPISQALKPEVLADILSTKNESKPYLTVDGIQKAAWADRMKERDLWRQKNIFESISGSSLLRLGNVANADHVMTISSGDPGLDPTNPDSAYDPVNQRYLVVWEEETSPGVFGIMGQFRSRTGASVGTPALISAPRTTQGCFYAAFDADNGEITTPSDCPKASNPAVAYNNGRYLIVWELHGHASIAHNSDGSDNESGKNFSSLIAKMVNADNLTASSPSWQEGILISRVWVSSNVGTPVANDAQVQAWAQSLNPDVAPKLGSDGFVTTWQSNKDFNGCVDPNRRDSFSIYARYVDQNFSPTAGASNKPIFAVYTDPSTVMATCPTLDNVFRASKPRIAYNSGRSDFMVAFEYARAGGATKGDIGAKKVTLNNSNDATVSNTMVADIVANAPEGSTYHNPDIASFTQNTFLAYDDASNISLKRLNTNDTSVTVMGEATNLDLGAAPAKTEPRLGGSLGIGGTRPDASLDPQRFLLAYSQGGDLKAAIFDDAFALRRGPVTVSGASTNNHLAEVASDMNNFLVVWAGTPGGSMIENVFGAVVNSLNDLPEPQLQTPPNGVVLTNLNPLNLTWSAVTGEGIVYDVYLGSAGGAPLIVSTGQAETHFSVNALSWGLSYQWRVVARDIYGRSSTSETRNFTTIPALNPPMLMSPANAPAPGSLITVNSIDLTWSAVAGDGIVYDVYEGLGALPGMPTAAGIAPTHFTVAGLTSQTSHQWKVVVRDMYGRSAESETRTYNVGNLNMPTAPVLAVQPADNITWAPTRLYLSWMASTDADVGDTVTYDVYFEPVVGAMDPLPLGAVPYRTGVLGTNFVIQASTDNRPLYTPSPAWVAAHPMGTSSSLIFNSHYAWKVCANDGRNNPPGITCSAVRHFNTDNSVVGWWRFDENPAGPLCAGAPMGSGKTVCDYSGNNNHGVPHGGPVWLVPPMADLLAEQLLLDGMNDYILVGDNSTLEGMAALSIQTWVKTSSVLGNKAIVAKAWVDPSSYALKMNPVDGNGTVIFGTITSAAPTLSVNSISVSSINNGSWHHVMGTYNGMNQKMYVDSALEATVPNSGDILNGNQEFCIGDYCNAGVGQNIEFDGSIDDTMIFNRGLSSQEVSNEYCSGLSSSCP